MMVDRPAIRIRHYQIRNNLADWLCAVGLFDSMEIADKKASSNVSLRRNLEKYYLTGIISDEMIEIIMRMVARNMKRRQYSHLSSHLDDLMNHTLSHFIKSVLPPMKKTHWYIIDPNSFFAVVISSCCSRYMAAEIRQQKIKNSYLEVYGK